MKYFIIAGEASGDLHGGNLIKAIKQQDPKAQFQFWGGDNMNAQSDGLLMHFKNSNIMGFIEVLLKIRTISSNLTLCKKQITAFNPDVVVLIDYPGFNLRIAAYCKSIGIKTAYYISPKVWAWNENRAKKLEKYIDKLLLIFPFEVPYFKKWKVNALFVGNPLLDAIKNFEPTINFRQQHKLDDRKIIALMPGSRMQEIKMMLPNMIKATQKYTDYQLVIAGAPSIDPSFYDAYLNSRVSIVFNQTYDILSQSTAAIVCSGTATLETALFNIPQVCGYVTNKISYQIAKLVIKVPFISLVNLNLNRMCITELLQHKFTPQNLISELDAILPNGSKREQMLQDYAELKTILGGEGASSRAATAIVMMANSI